MNTSLRLAIAALLCVTAVGCAKKTKPGGGDTSGGSNVQTPDTGRPDNGADNLDAPMDGPGQVHGSHPGRVLRHSPFTRLIGLRPGPGSSWRPR